MLNILLSSTDQPQIPLDTTDFDYNQFLNEFDDGSDTEDGLVENTISGKLLGLGPNGHFLADGDITERKFPLGFVIEDAIQEDYQNQPTLVSREVALVPMTAGVLIETDQYVKTEVTHTGGGVDTVGVGYTRGKPVYCGTGTNVGLIDSLRPGLSVDTEATIGDPTGPTASVRIGTSIGTPNTAGSLKATLRETGHEDNDVYSFNVRHDNSRAPHGSLYGVVIEKTGNLFTAYVTFTLSAIGVSSGLIQIFNPYNHTILFEATGGAWYALPDGGIAAVDLTGGLGHTHSDRTTTVDDASKYSKPIGYVYEDLEIHRENPLLKVLIVGSGV